MPDTEPTDRGTDRPTDADPEKVEAFREGLTMALYVSLSLLAVILATPTNQHESHTRLALNVGLTAIGLLLAHQVAFKLSTRLVNRGLLDEHSTALLAAQAVGGLAVAVVATVPVLVLGASGLWVSALLLLAVVVAVGYRTARVMGLGRARSWLYVGGIVVVVAVVILVKSLVGH